MWSQDPGRLIGYNILWNKNTCKYLRIDCRAVSVLCLFVALSLNIFYSADSDYSTLSRNTRSLPGIDFYSIHLQFCKFRREHNLKSLKWLSNKLLATNQTFKNECLNEVEWKWRGCKTNHCSSSPLLSISVYQCLSWRVLCATLLNILLAAIEELFCLPCLIVVLGSLVLLYLGCVSILNYIL